MGRGVAGLESELEGKEMTGPKQIYVLYIRTAPEKLWHGITSTGCTRQYFGLEV